MSIARTRALKTVANARSLSRMRYFGALSQGNASVICRASHSAVGFRVTAAHSSRRRRDGLRSDNGYGVKNARTATIQPDEEGTAGPVQMHPPWRALLQDIELMPKDQDFSFEPPARLEAVAQHADEKKGNCHHRPGSCSNSIRAATQADGVFGSDSHRRRAGGPFCAIMQTASPRWTYSWCRRFRSGLSMVYSSCGTGVG